MFLGQFDYFLGQQSGSLRSDLGSSVQGWDVSQGHCFLGWRSFLFRVHAHQTTRLRRECSHLSISGIKDELIFSAFSTETRESTPYPIRCSRAESSGRARSRNSLTFGSETVKEQERLFSFTRTSILILPQSGKWSKKRMEDSSSADVSAPWRGKEKFSSTNWR